MSDAPGRPSRPRPAPAPEPPSRAPSAGPRAGLWWRCLLGGVVLWVLAVVVTYTTQNSNLLPTLILPGSFLVPCCFTLWAYEKHGRVLGVDLLLGCFVVGGILGVLGASVLEYYLLHPSLTLFLGVGLIVVALLGVVWLTDLTRRAGRGNTP